jgi:hypothetical protein
VRVCWTNETSLAFALDILPESPVVARVGRRKSQKNLDNKNENKIGQKIKMTFGLGVCCV